MGTSPRKWKSLLHRVEYLRLEVEDRRELMREWEAELTRQLAEIDPPAAEASSAEPGPPGTAMESRAADPSGEVPPTDPESEGPEQPSPEEPSEPPVDERPESMRKLWKSIASRTHPDRTGGDGELAEIYKRAAAAWAAGDLDVLLEVALELRLPVPDPDPDMIRALEVKADVLDQELKGIEGTVLWAWGNSSADKRAAIAGAVVQNRRARRAAAAQARRG